MIRPPYPALLCQAAVATLLGVLVGCGASPDALTKSAAGAEASADTAVERPAGSDLTSVGPEGQTRIYYQFTDERHQVRFVERIEDVPPAWRDRVGFVELAAPPPLTPADARRATRADPAAIVSPRGPSVVLYYAEWCGYCRQAKRHLNDRGVAYSLRDVDVPAAKAELVARTGGKGVPVLDVDGRILRGYSSGSYDDFLRSTGL